MRRFVDLHTHSIASDGRLSPAEVVRLANAKRLAAVALTDHDTMEGLAAGRRAAEPFGDLRFIGGVEMSASYAGGTMHILALGVHERSAGLAELCRHLKAARDDRNPKMIARLQALGLKIDMQDVMDVAGQQRIRTAPAKNAGSQPSFPKQILGRVHMAEALRQKGYVADTAEAFARYIGTGCPAFVDKERLAASEVLAAIRQAGGLAVLAHPVQLRCGNSAQLVRVVRELIRGGLQGIEVYHSDHDVRLTRSLLELAAKLKLAVTGGSDFHCAAKSDVLLGRPRVPISVVGEELIEQLSRASDPVA